MKTALTFSISSVRLGMDIALVREVIPSVQLIKAPEMATMLRGFLNLEQTLIPVLRLEHLLQLDFSGVTWDPENDAGSKIIIADLGELIVAWLVNSDIELLTYSSGETVKLPKNHVLNNCAEQVIARPPPQPSIVLLERSRLLLESERVRIQQLRQREEVRFAEACES